MSRAFYRTISSDCEQRLYRQRSPLHCAIRNTHPHCSFMMASFVLSHCYARSEQSRLSQSAQWGLEAQSHCHNDINITSPSFADGSNTSSTRLLKFTTECRAGNNTL